jgi:ribosome biogenesis protein ENP2
VGTPALKPYMHGYFISLKLYDTARVIANPFAYAEHRERLVREKMEKLAESRIRARKEPGVKVNKGLAERVQREQERERKKEERRKQRTQKAANPDALDGEAMEVEEAVKDKVKDGKATILNDSRFSALFEDPEFQVDEGSREFALTNPSAASQRQAGGTDRPRAKTAVEDEEDESDKASSDGNTGVEADSDDNSDAGG